MSLLDYKTPCLPDTLGLHSVTTSATTMAPSRLERKYAGAFGGEWGGAIRKRLTTMSYCQLLLHPRPLPTITAYSCPGTI